jgi:hypothetical protein
MFIGTKEMSDLFEFGKSVLKIQPFSDLLGSVHPEMR